MFHFWSGHTFSSTSCLMLSFYLCLDFPSCFLRSGCSNPVSYAIVIIHKNSACPTKVIWTIQIMWYFVLGYSSSLYLIVGWNIFRNTFFLLLLTRTLFAEFVNLVQYPYLVLNYVWERVLVWFTLTECLLITVLSNCHSHVALLQEYRSVNKLISQNWCSSLHSS